jgi:hypothetical protein
VKLKALKSSPASALLGEGKDRESRELYVTYLLMVDCHLRRAGSVMFITGACEQLQRFRARREVQTATADAPLTARRVNPETAVQRNYLLSPESHVGEPAPRAN